MRRFITIVENAQEGVGSDPHYQFHLSVESELKPGRTFAQQTRRVSSAGERGEAGGEGIYTTTNLSYWISQLAHESVGEFPRYVYLVRVEHPSTGSVWAAHQDCSPPSEVTVLSLLEELDDDPDGPMPDVGKIIWRANKWLLQNDDATAGLKRFSIPYPGSLVAAAIGANEWENLKPGSVLPWGGGYMGGNGYILTMLDGNRVFLDATLEKSTIYMSQISVENRTSGLGSRVMEAIHRIAVSHGWSVIVYKVTNPEFFRRFSWLEETEPGTFRSK